MAKAKVLSCDKSLQEKTKLELYTDVRWNNRQMKKMLVEPQMDYTAYFTYYESSVAVLNEIKRRGAYNINEQKLHDGMHNLAWNVREKMTEELGY